MNAWRSVCGIWKHRELQLKRSAVVSGKGSEDVGEMDLNRMPEVKRAVSLIDSITQLCLNNPGLGPSGL